MRLRQNRLQTYNHKPAIPAKDEEGNVYTEYGLPTEFDAEVWLGGGKLQAEMYGLRLPYIRNIRIDASYDIVTDGRGRMSYKLNGTTFQEGDGICLYIPKNQDPDYKIVAIRPYRYLTLEVEKI